VTNLDINTPKGRESLHDEIRTVQIFQQHYENHRYLSTRKDSAAVIDAVVAKHDVLAAVVEAKGRSMSIHQLKISFNFRWLVTAAKLDKAAMVADALQVPLWGFLYLRPDDLLLVKAIYKPGEGGWTQHIARKITRTKATCNGGSADRLNAFVDMSNALQLRFNKKERA
jgi:hypothetical protein